MLLQADSSDTMYYLGVTYHDEQRAIRLTSRGRASWKRSQRAKLKRNILNLEIWMRRQTSGAILNHMRYLISAHSVIGDPVPLWLSVMAQLYEAAERRHLLEQINNWEELPMPWNRADYPEDWETVVRFVRNRAGDRCEHLTRAGLRCNAPNGEYIRRVRDNIEEYVVSDSGGTEEQSLRPKIRIVLTTAHICHCQPLCSNPTHLRSWCQLHHLRFDAQKHAQHARSTRARKLGLIPMEFE